MTYYADTEAGGYLEAPGHLELLRLLEDLNTTDNTFFVTYPRDEDLDWAISVHTRPGAFGGYEIEHRDAATGEQVTTPEADHATIATHVLDWISHR